MVAYSVVSLPLFGSMQETSTSCAWLMSTWGQNAPSGPCVLTPYCSQSFHFWQVLPTPNGQPHQGLHSGPILAQLQQTTCLCSKAEGALYTELIGFETLLARAYIWISFSMSFCHPLNLLAAGSMGSFVKNPGALYPTLLTRVGPTLLTRVGQELDQPF